MKKPRNNRKLQKITDVGTMKGAKKMQEMQEMVAKVTIVVVLGLMLLTGCKKKMDPEAIEAAHVEAQEIIKEQDYLELTNVERTSAAIAEMAEFTDATYNLDFLVAGVDNNDPASLSFDVLEFIVTFEDDGQDLAVRRELLADEVGTRLTTDEALEKSYEYINNGLLQVHGVIMSWSVIEDTEDGGQNVRWYHLVDESGDGVWDYAVLAHSVFEGPVEFEGADGHCNYNGATAVDLEETWSGSLEDVEALFE